MAGLLDGFGEFAKTPEGQGLLSAVFGGLAGAKRGAPLNSLGTAGLAGLQGYSGALDRNMQMDQNAQRNKLMDAQLQNYQSEIDQRKNALAIDQQKRATLPSLFTGGSPSLAPLAGDSSTGILPSSGRAAVAPSFDINKAVSSGLYTPQEIESWAKVPTAGMTEVARTMKGMQNGKEVDQQYDKFGRPVGVGLEQYKAPLMQDLGGNVSALDPYTLKPQAVLPKTMTFGDKAAVGNLAVSQQRLAHDIAQSGVGADGTVSGNAEQMAQMIAAGKMAPPSGFAAARPISQTIMARVSQINPEYDATDYAAKTKAARDFTSGTQGNAMRSFAVAGQHLDQLGTLVDALNNRDTNLINKAGNAWATQTGQPAPTNFDAAKDIVSKEVIKAIVGGGGGVDERRELAHLMDQARSPTQLKGVISQYRGLMDAQHNALLQQRRAAGLSDSTLPKYGAPEIQTPVAGSNGWGIKKVGP